MHLNSPNVKDLVLSTAELVTLLQRMRKGSDASVGYTADFDISQIDTAIDELYQ